MIDFFRNRTRTANRNKEKGKKYKDLNKSSRRKSSKNYTIATRQMPDEKADISEAERNVLRRHWIDASRTG